MGSLFIGKLPDGFEREDLEKAFEKFGKVTRADVKRGPASNFGFVEVNSLSLLTPSSRTETRQRSLLKRWTVSKSTPPVSLLNGQRVVPTVKTETTNASTVEARVTGLVTAVSVPTTDVVEVFFSLKEIGGGGYRGRDNRDRSRSPARRRYRSRSRSRSPPPRRYVLLASNIS
jgi:RNA recognition motif-containing protein